MKTWYKSYLREPKIEAITAGQARAELAEHYPAVFEVLISQLKAGDRLATPTAYIYWQE